MNNADLIKRARQLLAKTTTACIASASAAPVIQPGALVTWTRGDGTRPEGFVDFIHTDDTGTRWAFVSLPGGRWAVVNVKFLKEVTP